VQFSICTESLYCILNVWKSFDKTLNTENSEGVEIRGFGILLSNKTCYISYFIRRWEVPH